MKYSLLFVIILFTTAAFAQEAKSKVNWMTFEEAVEASKTEKKKIFVDVYTDWCGWCKVMDKNTFNQETVATYLNANFYPVKLDGEQKEDIEFRGTTFKFVPSGRKGYHQLAAALLNGQLSYPTVIFLDEDFNMLQPLKGYQKAPFFFKVMNYIADGHYKNTEWKEFDKSFVVPFE